MIVHGKNDWGRVRWRGGVMDHPVQRDKCSCGVIVTMVMAVCVCVCVYVFVMFTSISMFLYQT